MKGNPKVKKYYPNLYLLVISLISLGFIATDVKAQGFLDNPKNGIELSFSGASYAPLSLGAGISGRISRFSLGAKFSMGYQANNVSPAIMPHINAYLVDTIPFSLFIQPNLLIPLSGYGTSAQPQPGIAIGAELGEQRYFSQISSGLLITSPSTNITTVISYIQLAIGLRLWP
jgi:hypothetical protein